MLKVFEENVDVRLSKISKACKKITDLLPFEKRSTILCDQPDLTKYLLLCLPLFGKSVSFVYHLNKLLFFQLEIILKSLIFRFKSKDDFILNFWKNLEYVGSLSEIEENNKFKVIRKSTIFAGVQLANQGNEEEKTYSLLRYDFCRDLLANKYYLKCKSLDFIKILIKILYVHNIIIL